MNGIQMRVNNQIDHRRNFFERLKAGKVQGKLPKKVALPPVAGEARTVQATDASHPLVLPSKKERIAQAKLEKPSLAQLLSVVNNTAKKTGPRIEVPIGIPKNPKAKPKAQPLPQLVPPVAVVEPVPVAEPVQAVAAPKVRATYDPLTGLAEGEI
jgi:hypothetical protein